MGPWDMKWKISCMYLPSWDWNLEVRYWFPIMSNLQKTEIHLLAKHLLIVLPHPSSQSTYCLGSGWTSVSSLLVHKSGLPQNLNRFECSWQHYVLWEFWILLLFMKKHNFWSFLLASVDFLIWVSKKIVPLKAFIWNPKFHFYRHFWWSIKSFSLQVQHFH